MRNPSYDAYFSFLATFGRKMGVATTHAPNKLIVWGLKGQSPTKKLAHWVDLLCQPLSRSLVFEIFRHETPLDNAGVIMKGVTMHRVKSYLGFNPNYCLPNKIVHYYYVLWD